jgi:hypothetical protein
VESRITPSGVKNYPQWSQELPPVKSRITPSGVKKLKKNPLKYILNNPLKRRKRKKRKKRENMRACMYKKKRILQKLIKFVR